MSKGPWSTKIDVYGVRLHLATRKKDLDKIRRELTSIDKRAHDNAGSTSFIIEHQPGGATQTHIVIWINGRSHRKSGPAELVNTVAHEAFHAAQFVCERLELERGGEAQAYLTGWITEWAWKRAGV